MRNNREGECCRELLERLSFSLGWLFGYYQLI